MLWCTFSGVVAHALLKLFDLTELRKHGTVSVYLYFCSIISLQMGYLISLTAFFPEWPVGHPLRVALLTMFLLSFLLLPYWLRTLHELTWFQAISVIFAAVFITGFIGQVVSLMVLIVTQVGRSTFG